MALQLPDYRLVNDVNITPVDFAGAIKSGASARQSMLQNKSTWGKIADQEKARQILKANTDADGVIDYDNAVRKLTSAGLQDYADPLFNQKVAVTKDRLSTERGVALEKFRQAVLAGAPIEEINAAAAAAGVSPEAAAAEVAAAPAAPAAPAAQAAPAAPVAPSEYIVQKGEGLSHIAKKLNIKNWQDIAAANNLKAPYTIREGQKLIIPGQGSAAPVAPQAAPAPAPAAHVIKAGERISDIAQQNGTTVEAIQKANNLDQSKIPFAGQQLIIPGNTSGYEYDWKVNNPEEMRTRGEIQRYTDRIPLTSERNVDTKQIKNDMEQEILDERKNKYEYDWKVNNPEEMRTRGQIQSYTAADIGKVKQPNEYTTRDDWRYMGPEGVDQTMADAEEAQVAPTESNVPSSFADIAEAPKAAQAQVAPTASTSNQTFANVADAAKAPVQEPVAPVEEQTPMTEEQAIAQGAAESESAKPIDDKSTFVDTSAKKGTRPLTAQEIAHLYLKTVPLDKEASLDDILRIINPGKSKLSVAEIKDAMLDEDFNAAMAYPPTKEIVDKGYNLLTSGTATPEAIRLMQQKVIGSIGQNPNLSGSAMVQVTDRFRKIFGVPGLSDAEYANRMATLQGAIIPGEIDKTNAINVATALRKFDEENGPTFSLLRTIQQGIKDGHVNWLTKLQRQPGFLGTVTDIAKAAFLTDEQVEVAAASDKMFQSFIKANAGTAVSKQELGTINSIFGKGPFDKNAKFEIAMTLIEKGLRRQRFMIANPHITPWNPAVEAAIENDTFERDYMGTGGKPPAKPTGGKPTGGKPAAEPVSNEPWNQ